MIKKSVAIFIFCILFWPFAAMAEIRIQSVTSNHGITAWLIEDHTLPIISINFSMPSPESSVPIGTHDMAASLLTEGAGSYNSLQFQQKLTDLASSINFSADQDYFSGSMRSLRKNLDASMELMAMCLNAPKLDKSSIERVRSQMIASIKNGQSDPETIASQLWAKSFFGDHRYGQFPTVESVQSVQKSHIRDYLRQTLNRGGLIIGVAGDITPDELKILIDKTFAGLPNTPAANANRPIPTNRPGGEYRKSMDLKQTVAYFGHAGVKRNDPDFYPAYVMNYILGGGSFSSRLMEVVRDQHGLAYSVSTSLQTLRDGGIISGYVATKSENFSESQRYIRDIWQTLPDTISDNDVDAAKQYLLGSFPLRFSSTAQISAILVAIQQDDLGIDFFTRRNAMVDAVTPDDVRRTAKKLLSPEHLLFAIVGPDAKPEPSTPKQDPTP